jgi:hypothetical protein
VQCQSQLWHRPRLNLITHAMVSQGRLVVLHRQACFFCRARKDWRDGLPFRGQFIYRALCNLLKLFTCFLAVFARKSSVIYATSSSYERVLAILLMHCLTPTPNHRKLNEIAPAVTGAISLHGCTLQQLCIRMFFCASASLRRQTAYFLPVAASPGRGDLDSAPNSKI